MMNESSSSPDIRTSQAAEFSQAIEDYSKLFVPPEHKYVQVEKFTSPYFQDNNQEQYAIQRAFQSNNFNYLRKLPDNFSRNCILERRLDRVKDQIEDETVVRMRDGAETEKLRKQKIEEIKKQKIGALGYFEVFPYQESNYQIPKKIAQIERELADEKRKEICESDFKPMGFDKKMKYQDPFKYTQRGKNTGQKEEYLFPFHLPEDVYDSFHESEKRKKIVEKQMKLAGDFLPSQTGYTLRTVTKSKLPQILQEIQFYIKKYLKDIGYFIGVNKRDHIQVLFESKHRHNPKLKLVMSSMFEHEMLSKYLLRKSNDRWGVINSETTHIQYVILPQWVREKESLMNVSS